MLCCRNISGSVQCCGLFAVIVDVLERIVLLSLLLLFLLLSLLFVCVWISFVRSEGVFRHIRSTGISILKSRRKTKNSDRRKKPRFIVHFSLCV